MTKTNKPRSNGGKAATCVRCEGEIQPYAGRAVSAYGGRFIHHPGQCADYGERIAATRDAARQGELFAWTCQRLTAGDHDDMSEVCDVTGTDRAEYAAHMKGHGATQLSPTMPKIRLRKVAAAGKRQAPAVAPFKRIAWTQTHQMMTREGDAHYGPQWETVTTQHVGQFWSNGPHANEVIVIEDRRAARLPNRLVTLYLDGNGRLTADWSAAKSSRRANRLAA